MAKPDRVNPKAAMLALQAANWDKQKAYSEYIRLHFKATGQLAPECDNKDLMAYYDMKFKELYITAKDVVEVYDSLGEITSDVIDELGKLL